jgi:hypothetical protein
VLAGCAPGEGSGTCSSAFAFASSWTTSADCVVEGVAVGVASVTGGAVLVDGGVGSGSVVVVVVGIVVCAEVEAGAVVVASSTLGIDCPTCCVLGSCVAAGVGGNSCRAAVTSLGGIDDSGSACVVCASTIAGVGAGAAGLEAAATGTAPGLLRAALGANFLPVVFSKHSSA